MFTRRLAAGAALLGTAGALCAAAPAQASATPTATGVASTARTSAATASTLGASTAAGISDAARRRHPSRRATLPFRMSVAAPGRLPDGRTTAGMASEAVGITEAGVVAGNLDDTPADYDSPTVPFMGGGWLARTVRMENGTTQPAYLTAVSSNGRAAGRAYGRAVRWEGGRPQLLPRNDVPEGAAAIDAAGDVLGTCEHPYGSYAVRWTGGRAAQPTGGPRDGGYAAVSDMADTGLGIATFTRSPHGPRGGVYPKAYALTPRGAVPFRVPVNTAATADAVSPNGAWIVGRTGPADSDPTRVVRLSTTATARPIPGALSGFRPKDVNDLGQIVGSFRGHAAGWMSGKLVDFNLMTKMPQGWILTDAIGITRRGDIAANATNPTSGKTVAVKLTLVG